MNILSIFTAKKSIKEQFTSENIDKFLTTAHEAIKAAQRFKAMSGTEKKAYVDDICTKWLKENIDTSNGVVYYIVNTILIPSVPFITQRVYDFVKSNISGITRLTRKK